jgi:hypothetical protein
VPSSGRINQSIDNQNEFPESKKDGHSLQNKKVLPLIPREISSMHQVLLNALDIANTLRESKFISEAYYEYVSSNSLIVKSLLKSLEKINFQVDLTWWNTALKTARAASNNYEESIRTLNRKTVSNQDKWQKTYQLLIELENYFRELFESL